MPGLTPKASVPDPIEVDTKMEEVVPDAAIDEMPDIDEEQLEQAIDMMESANNDAVLTEDLDDILLSVDGTVTLPPIPSGIINAKGQPVHMSVTARDPHDPAVIAAYVENESKNASKAQKDLWDAVVVKPAGLTSEAIYPRLTQSFRDALTVNCLRIAGWDGFFERFKFLARPGMVQAATKSSTKSPTTTVSHQQK